MKKHLLLSTLLVVLFSASFFACKKEDKDPSRQELIVGTWNLTAFGEDVNNNGRLEPDETQPTDPKEINRQTFNAGGSGQSEYSDSQISLKESFSWALSNNGQNLRITQGQETVDLMVAMLTQNRFELSQEDNGARFYFVFTK